MKLIFHSTLSYQYCSGRRATSGGGGGSGLNRITLAVKQATSQLPSSEWSAQLAVAAAAAAADWLLVE